MNKTEHLPGHSKLLELLHAHPHLNVMPLLELVAEQTPDYLEAFCNEVIFTISELLREDQPGGVPPSQIMQIIGQLHTLREALRQVRGAPALKMPPGTYDKPRQLLTGFVLMLEYNLPLTAA